jgi:hypothetical protein
MLVADLRDGLLMSQSDQGIDAHVAHHPRSDAVPLPIWCPRPTTQNQQGRRLRSRSFNSYECKLPSVGLAVPNQL